MSKRETGKATLGVLRTGVFHVVVEHFFQEGLVEVTGTGDRDPPSPPHCALLDALADEADLLWRGERTLKETFLPFLHHNFSCVGAKAERASFYRVSLKNVCSPQPRAPRKRPSAESVAHGDSPALPGGGGGSAKCQ